MAARSFAPKLLATALLATLPGLPLHPVVAQAQGDVAKPADASKPDSAANGTLAQAAAKWEEAALTDAAPLYEKALKEGGMFPADVIIAYSRIGTVQALMKQRDAALSSFRVAAVIDPQFQLPSESGKLAKELYEKARKDAAKQGGKLEVTMEAPEKPVEPNQGFTVVAKIDEAFAPVVDKIGIEVRDTTAKSGGWKSDQPSTSSVTFEVPAKVVTGSTTLLVRVSALDQNGNRWAMKETRVKVKEGKVEPVEAPPPPEEKKGGGFFSTPWPYAIAGVIVVGAVVAFLATRPPSEANVGAPTINSTASGLKGLSFGPAWRLRNDHGQPATDGDHAEPLGERVHRSRRPSGGLRHLRHVLSRPLPRGRRDRRRRHGVGAPGSARRRRWVPEVGGHQAHPPAPGRR